MAWSPIGSLIAFSSMKGSTFQVFDAQKGGVWRKSMGEKTQGWSFCLLRRATWDPFQMAYLRFVNRVDPNHLQVLG